MQTYDLLAQTKTQPSKKGSESGYTLCPLCPHTTKLFARGRGINTHLSTKHKNLSSQEYLEIVEKINLLPIIWKVKQEQNTPELLAFCRDNQLLALQKMIEKGANVLQQDKNGSNGLHWASGQGNLEIVKYLCEIHDLKGDLGYKEKDGRTAMHWAARNGKIEIMEYFLKSGVDVNVFTKDGTTPLMLACYGGQLNAYISNLDAQLQLRNQYGCDVTHWVAMGGSWPVAEYLLGLQIDFSTKQKEGQNFQIGQNSLHKASIKGNLEFIKGLIQHIDISILTEKDTSGYMPFELADIAGHQETKKFLQQKINIKKVKL